MKSLQITRFGGPEVLKLVEGTAPPLGAGEIRIQVEAAGVNFADIMMRMGLYPEAPKPPFVPGYEVAGSVTEVGTGVTTFKTGDRVVAGTKFGGYTDEIVLPAFQARRIPAHLSAIEAACIPVNFMTAWVALQDMGRVRKGDRVLVQSAAGGVGVAAVQIAANAGAEVIGLVGSPSKADAVKALGAAEVWTNDRWEQDSAADLGEFDIILDASGGKSLKRCFSRLAKAGRVVNFGVSTMVSGKRRSISKAIGLFLNTPLYTPFKLMMENKGVYGLNALQLFEVPKPGERPPLMARVLDAIMEEFEKKRLKVVVGQTFPLERGGEAHERLMSRGNVGKIVLTGR